MVLVVAMTAAALPAMDLSSASEKREPVSFGIPLPCAPLQTVLCCDDDDICFYDIPKDKPCPGFTVCCSNLELGVSSARLGAPR